MPYTQKWGISRNAFQSPLNYDDPAEISSREEDMPAIPKVDTDPNSDEDIIEQNNDIADADKDIIKANNEATTWDDDLNEEEKRIVTGEGRSYDKKNISLTAAGLGPAYGAFFDAGNTVLGGIRTATNFIGDTARGVRGEGWDYSRTKARAKETGWAGVGIIPATQGLTGGKLAKNLLGQNKVFKLAKAKKTYDQTIALRNKGKSTESDGRTVSKGPIPDGMGSTISAFSKFGPKMASWLFREKD